MSNVPGKKSKLASFKYTLQDLISLNDREWRFQVPNLPNAQELDQKRLVKTISVVNTRNIQQILLTLEPVEENRAIRADLLSKYLLVSFAKFRPPPRKSTAGSAWQPSTPSECVYYAVRLLRAGISLQGIVYNFYGHSNSELKSRTCFLYAASKEDISRKVESLGDFAKMKTVAKKAKRIGLLFSTARVAKIVKPDRVKDIPDVESIDYIFTDGCGLISPHITV